MSSYLPSSLLPENTFQFIFVTSSTSTTPTPTQTDALHNDINHYNNFVQKVWDSSTIKSPVYAALDITSITWKCICSTAGHCPEKGTITNARDNVVFVNDGDVSGIYTLGAASAPLKVTQNTNTLFTTSTSPLHNLHNPININQNGVLDPHHHDKVWTGSDDKGIGILNSHGGVLGSNGGSHSVYGNYNQPGTKWIFHSVPKPQGVKHHLYALSEVLTMPPIFPPTPPYPPSWPVLPVNPSGKARFPFPAPIPKSAFCRPICLINIRDFSVNQPAPPEESTKMRHAKRINGRGWRKMSLKQYNEMKRGGLPFLGTCYQKKNH